MLLQQGGIYERTVTRRKHRLEDCCRRSDGKFLRMAEKEEVVITRHGKPAGILIGFEDEEDWLDYRIENDPRFLKRIERARRSVRTGMGTK